MVLLADAAGGAAGSRCRCRCCWLTLLLLVLLLLVLLLLVFVLVSVVRLWVVQMAGITTGSYSSVAAAGKGKAE